MVVVVPKSLPRVEDTGMVIAIIIYECQNYMTYYRCIYAER
jgi:hypothetical protein